MPGFDVERLFGLVASPKRIIDETQLRRFFIKVGHQPLKQELTNIMRRFDLDGDRIVTVQEFCEALLPTVVIGS